MQAKSGKEMRKLLVAVSVTTLVLVLAVIAYFMIDVIVTTNSNPFQTSPRSEMRSTA